MDKEGVPEFLPCQGLSQNGFSSGRGCADGSFCIRQALKKRREHGQESWVLFVDLVNAEIGWRPTPEKNIETMPCWGKK